MQVFREQLRTILTDGASDLESVGVPGETLAYLARLGEQVFQPCVVAVVGRVKAGKSTFINALLGDDLAKVGTTETTATINYFRYGTPDPEKPVICHWRGGGTERVSRAFLDDLQGNDLDTLRRAEGIDHFEFCLPNPYLERVTLVDTPGTGAVVEEHQNRTAEFLTLYSRLRQRHDTETRDIQRDADAVIYLIGCSAATTTDRDFLEAFNQIAGQDADPMNAIGVLSKIDLNPDLLARRHELAAKMATQLRDTLNTVVPVSAGLHRRLAMLRANAQAGLREISDTLSTISATRLKKMLDNETLYLADYADCPVSVDRRESLLADMPWKVFTTIASGLTSGRDLEDATLELEELSGFTELRAVLEQHIFQRSDFLRCYRIVTDARQVLSALRYRHLPGLEQAAREQQALLESFIRFAELHRDSDTIARELHSYLIAELEARGNSDEFGRTIANLEAQLSTIYHELVEYNADFTALQGVNECPDYFDDGELDELRPLLGQYGVEFERRLPPHLDDPLTYIKERQVAWLKKAWDRDGIRRLAIERAAARYGLMLRDIDATSGV